MKKEEENNETEKYQASIELLFYEGQMLWQIMSTFMVINTIFLGFVSSQLDFKTNSGFEYNLACFLAGIFGLLLLIPWWGTFLRNSDYYHFRMSQAKIAEPANWKLLKDNGESFAEGHKVKIGTKTHRISWFGRNMKNKRAIYWLISIFMVIYLSLIFSYGPWWTSKVSKEHNKHETLTHG